MRVAIRVDAGPYIGVGHVMRCCALADYIRDSGNDVVFICRAHEGHMGNYLIAKGYKVHMLPMENSISQRSENNFSASLEEDLSQTIDVLKGASWEWLIVDHYDIDHHWLANVRACVDYILVIDDLANRHYDCDLLLDQTYGRKASDYYPLVPANSEVLTGSKYAILRPEFAELRSQSIRRRQHSQLTHLLITLGGGEQQEMLNRIIEALAESSLPETCRITMVVGAASNGLYTLKESVKKLKWDIDVRQNVSQMGELMVCSDLVIGAAGTTSWERCCLGVPTLMLVLADNQKKIASELAKAGAVILLGEKQMFQKELLHNSIARCRNSNQLKLMSEYASKICDGLGGPRVLDRMQSI